MEATDKLFHRGPDEGDVWIDPAAGVALGHRRLSIVELSAAGHQPMHSQNGRYVLSFNGEIYNHIALRSLLADAGYSGSFVGGSDTETLLASFEQWGIERTLQKALGMFALGVWDRSERRLTLARDRLGEKPIYYGWSSGAFLFGSELVSLTNFPGFRNEIDPDVLALYMQYGYVPAPYSIYKSVFKLEPGTYLSLDISAADGPPNSGVAPCAIAPKPNQYWSLENAFSGARFSQFSSESEAVDELEKTLKAAVEDQLMADVPVGAFLSGGIDSSSIVAMMRQVSRGPVRSFTIGFFVDGFNEAVHAAEVARHLGTEHTELYVTPKHALDIVPKLPSIYSEPFADSSQIPTFLVSQLAKQSVSVALSGDGGDELFGGYNRHIWTKKVWGPLYRVPRPLRSLIGASVEHVPEAVWSVSGRLLPTRFRSYRFQEKLQKLGRRLRTVHSIDDLYYSLVTEWPRSIVPSSSHLDALQGKAPWINEIADPESRMMVRDTLTYLPDDILQKVDRAAMAVSLETRVPMLDRRVVELAARTPLHMKLRNGKGKWLLRQVLSRYLPDKLVNRPKAGFAVPVGAWLRDPLRDWAEDLLSERKLGASGLLDVEGIRLTWDQHLAGKTDASPRLWTALMFSAWYEAQVQAGSPPYAVPQVRLNV